MRNLIALAFLTAAPLGCDTTTGCTLAGCGPGIVAKVHGLGPGAGELLFGAGDASLSCAWTRLEEAEQCGISVQVDGTGALSLWLEPDLDVGVPTDAHLVLEADGEVIFDDLLPLEFERNEVNGPGCGECAQATPVVDLN